MLQEHHTATVAFTLKVNHTDLDLEVVREQVYPLGDPSCQSLLDGLGIDLDVADGGACGQRLDLFLDCSVLGDLCLKAVQGRVITCPIFQLLALSSQELLQGTV